jgi:hypothetical protein
VISTDRKVGVATDFTMEDVAFYLNAAEAGSNVFVDLTKREGHEKKTEL